MVIEVNKDIDRYQESVAMGLTARQLIFSIAIYQDVCYPVTKDFREKLYNEIISEYEKAKDKSNEKARESAEKHHGNPDKEKDKAATPFR